MVWVLYAAGGLALIRVPAAVDRLVRGALAPAWFLGIGMLAGYGLGRAMGRGGRRASDGAEGGIATAVGLAGLGGDIALGWRFGAAAGAVGMGSVWVVGAVVGFVYTQTRPPPATTPDR